MSALRHVDPYAERSRLYRALCSIAATRAGLWLSAHLLWRLDPVLLRLSGGRLSSAGPIPAALLETRGARSGLPRHNAVLYCHDGRDVIIVASRAGAPRHPAWFHNLCANPDVQFGGAPFRAVVVQDESERERLQALVDRVFPPFARYREWAAEAGRTIPIVRLRPR